MGYEYLKDQASYDADALVTTQYEENTTVSGYAYIVENYFSLAGSATSYIQVDPSAMSNTRFTVLPTAWGCSASYLAVTLGTASAFSGGTTITSLNRNYYFATSRAADTVVKRNVTPTGAVDTDISWVVGTAVQGVALGGGDRISGGIQILDPTLKYYFKIVNQTGTATVVTARIKWFETPYTLHPKGGF